MPTQRLVRWSALLFALGGVAFALFIYLANGEFSGAELGLTQHHHLTHLAHFYSALFFLFGIVGFYAAHRAQSGIFGLVAFTVAMTGTALFCGTGVITAFVWRTISANAPQLVESHGAFFDPPLRVIFVGTIGFSLGHALLGVIALRARILPRAAAVLYIIGALLVLLPPPPFGPVPYVVIAGGATLFMLGTVWLAASLWQVADSDVAATDATRVFPAGERS